MKHHAARIAACIAVVAVALTLTACGGGGGDSPDPVDLLLDPRVIRLGRIIERSDSLITPGLHLKYEYSLSIGNADPIKEEGEVFQNVRCDEADCTIQGEDEGGTMVDLQDLDLQDLIDLSVELGSADVSLGSRGGFDTITISSDLDVLDSIPASVNTDMYPSATSLGFWGVHGFAGVAIGNGLLSGSVELADLQTTARFDDGRLYFALAYAMGKATGSNPPPDTEIATWEGIAEAAALRTFERRTGTVTLTIADLASPSISVDIVVDDFSIAEPEWADVTLTSGSFTFGTAGNDYLAGNFYGPAHEEAYGVFDTGSYTGAFGAAKRSN